MKTYSISKKSHSYSLHRTEPVPLSLIQQNGKHSFVPATKNEMELFAEGKPKKVTYKTYDRSPAARQACIDHWGYSCGACNFNFESTYGSLGKNYIEVHHLRQIADVGEEYLIDPETDLRPVCANCHRMLHKNRPPISIDELKMHNKANSADAKKPRG